MKKINARHFILLLVILFSCICTITWIKLGSLNVKCQATYQRQEIISSPDTAHRLLVEGNKRFVSGHTLKKNFSHTRMEKLSKEGQHPFAIVVCCSDSRVAPELLFDEGMGDLFIIRDAGNVIDPVMLGSIEYGAQHLQTPLILVLGHDHCGAVLATYEGGSPEGSISSIAKIIEPSLEKAKKTCTTEEDICEETEDENILNSIETIKKSPIIEKLIKEGAVKVEGAKYHISSGKVEFLSDNK